jgi:hypothetical protein
MARGYTIDVTPGTGAIPPEQGPESVFEANWPSSLHDQLVPEWIWRQTFKSNSSPTSDWKPAATIMGGGNLATILPPRGIPGKDGNIDLAAAGDLKCQTCASGGSWERPACTKWSGEFSAEIVPSNGLAPRICRRLKKFAL